MQGSAKFVFGKTSREMTDALCEELESHGRVHPSRHADHDCEIEAGDRWAVR